MPPSPTTRILFVDDEPDSVNPQRLQLEKRDIQAQTVHPADIETESLRDLHLVLVDHRLDEWTDDDWPNAPALRPTDGLALSAVLRARCKRLGADEVPAFALFSGHLEDIGENWPHDYREHVVAAQHDLEWAFAKGQHETDNDDNPPVMERCASLATAVRRLWETTNVDGGTSINTVLSLLSLTEEAEWRDYAAKEVEACRPPLHQLTDPSPSWASLRWLLHRILPYPTFLWDRHWLSARLGLTYDSFKAVVAGRTDLAAKLHDFQYVGILCDFAGRRWWRAGIEWFLWDVTQGRSFDSDAVVEALSSLAREDLEEDASDQPVVCLGDNFKPLPTPCDIDEAVRIQIDDWPAFAEQAWTSRDEARKSDILKALVVLEDSEGTGNQ